MLRPLGTTRQIPGEPRRRWFFSRELDLVVWFDEEDRPYSFQLAYDKDDGEHSISWHPQRGYWHYRVCCGSGPRGRLGTPLLYANGPFDRDRILDRFIALAAEMPPPVVDFVAARLRGFEGARKKREPAADVS